MAAVNQYHCVVVGKEANTATLVNASMYDAAATAYVGQMQRAGLLADGDVVTITKGAAGPTLKYSIQATTMVSYSLADAN